MTHAIASPAVAPSPRSIPVAAAIASALASWLLVGCASREQPAPAAAWSSAPLSLGSVDVDRDCKTNAFTDLVLSELAAGNGRPDRTGWTGHVIEHRLHNWDGVAWRGLTLAGIGSLNGIESGPSVFSFYFKEPPATVLSRLNALGYDLPAVGEDRGIDGALSIGVRADGEGAALTCWFD